MQNLFSLEVCIKTCVNEIVHSTKIKEDLISINQDSPVFGTEPNILMVMQ